MDRHLNPFYSYNRDNELIENNLTRAFIVTLRAVGPGAREAILRPLLAERLRDLGVGWPSFDTAEFALQGHVDRGRVRRSAAKFVITIAADLEDVFASHPELVPGASVPDAWLLVEDHCFLIEAKVGANPLDERQVQAHACGWLGLEPGALPQRHIGLTWYQVRRALEDTLSTGGTTVELNEQERFIVRSLADFLDYFGYRHFQGFGWALLRQPPVFSFVSEEQIHGLALSSQPEPPTLWLGRTSA